MRRLLIVAALSATLTSALAQEPTIPAGRPDPTVPVTLDVATYKALMQFLQDVPMRWASPIAAALERNQMQAQAAARQAEIQKMTKPKDKKD